MSPYQLVISPAAKNDLKRIFQYGQRQWGQTQSEHYLSRIKNQLWLITQQPLMGIQRPELLKSIRSFPIDSHTLFYRIRDTKVEIVRILHGRQDPQRYLK